MERAETCSRKLRRRNRSGIVSVLVAVGAALLPVGGYAQEPIRLGVLMSTTGPAGYVGEPGLKTIQLYAEKINEAGGLLGRKLQVISYDDGTDTSKANSFGKRLLETDKVDVLLGGSTTGSALALVPLAEAHETPFVTTAGGSALVEPVHKWVFKTSQTDRMAAERVFQDIKKRGITKVALLTETSSFGQGGRAEASKVAPKYGLTIVADETFAPKDGDMTAQLTKIRGGDAGAVFVYGTNPGAAIVTKNYRQLGIKVPLYQAHGVSSNDFIRLAGDAANGVRLPSMSILAASTLPTSDPEYPIVSGYAKDFKQKYGEDAQPFGANIYDGLMLYIGAVKRAGTTDKAKVRDAMEQTNDMIGCSGVVHMSATDHLGLSLSSFRIVEVDQGHFKLIPD